MILNVSFVTELLYDNILKTAESLTYCKKSADELLSELQEHLLDEELSDDDAGEYTFISHFSRILVLCILHIVIAPLKCKLSSTICNFIYQSITCLPVSTNIRKIS